MKNFSDVLKTTVNVTSIKLSNDLKEFYQRTLPYIFKFLYTEIDMFDESYKQRKLNEIFSQMKFFIVDNIQVTYEYKNISFDSNYSCYIDNKLKRFYLLKTQHYSQSIDTIIEFILNDIIQECQYKRDRLHKYYRKLLTAYSKNQLEENIIDNDDDDDDAIKLTWEKEISDQNMDENQEQEENNDKDVVLSFDEKRAKAIIEEEEVEDKRPKSTMEQSQTHSNKSAAVHNKQFTTTERAEHQQSGKLYSTCRKRSIHNTNNQFFFLDVQIPYVRNEHVEFIYYFISIESYTM